MICGLSLVQIFRPLTTYSLDAKFKIAAADRSFVLPSGLITLQSSGTHSTSTHHISSKFGNMWLTYSNLGILKMAALRQLEFYRKWIMSYDHPVVWKLTLYVHTKIGAYISICDRDIP